MPREMFTVKYLLGSEQLLMFLHRIVEKIMKNKSNQSKARRNSSMCTHSPFYILTTLSLHLYHKI